MTTPHRATKETIMTTTKAKSTNGKDDTKKITLVPAATIPFRDGSIRHQRWACVKNGATVGDTITAIEKKGLKRARRFVVQTCVEKRLLTIQ